MAKSSEPKAYVYKTITPEQQRQILDQRLANLEAEHYSHELNKCATKSLPDSDEKTAAIAAADEAQAIIVNAIGAVTTELDALPAAAE